MKRRVRVTANRQRVRGEAGDAKTYETDVKKAAPTYRRTPACTEPEVVHRRVRMEVGREATSSADTRLSLQAS